MAREPAGYREKLEILNNRFPNQDAFTVKEIMNYMGIANYRTASKYLNEYVNIMGRIYKDDFARILCKKRTRNQRKSVLVKQ